MLVALISVKGSPGASTLALGIAARWPQPGAVLVEADPAGGDLATRFGLFHKPGLSTMALSTRIGPGQPQPRQWLQRLPCGVPAVLAAPGPTAASLATLGEHGPAALRLLAAQHPALLLDAGRWQPGSPVDAMLAVTDAALIVLRPVPEEIRQAEARIKPLRELASDLRLVLVGDRGTWPAREIGDALGVPVAEVVPVDRHGAGLLTGRMVPRNGWASSGWTRLPLLRSCYSIALRLARQAASPEAGAASPAGVRPPVDLTSLARDNGRAVLR